MAGIDQGRITSKVIPFGGMDEFAPVREGSKYGIEDYIEMNQVCTGHVDH